MEYTWKKKLEFRFLESGELPPEHRLEGPKDDKRLNTNTNEPLLEKIIGTVTYQKNLAHRNLFLKDQV
jgi:hypothetical protein